MLDEPNSNLDAEGERAFAATIETLKTRGRTILIVTHHPAALRNADKLLVIREGTSVAFGDCQHVLAKLRAGSSVVPLAAASRQAIAAEPPEAAVESASGE